jgi:hypothetical protein
MVALRSLVAEAGRDAVAAAARDEVAAVAVGAAVSATTFEALGVSGVSGALAGWAPGARTSVADEAAPPGVCGLRAAPFACWGIGLCPV